MEKYKQLIINILEGTVSIGDIKDVVKNYKSESSEYFKLIKVFYKTIKDISKKTSEQKTSRKNPKTSDYHMSLIRKKMPDYQLLKEYGPKIFSRIRLPRSHESALHITMKQLQHCNEYTELKKITRLLLKKGEDINAKAIGKDYYQKHDKTPIIDLLYYLLEHKSAPDYSILDILINNPKLDWNYKFLGSIRFKEGRLVFPAGNTLLHICCMIYCTSDLFFELTYRHSPNDVREILLPKVLLILKDKGKDFKNIKDIYNRNISYGILNYCDMGLYDLSDIKHITIIRTDDRSGIYAIYCYNNNMSFTFYENKVIFSMKSLLRGLRGKIMLEKGIGDLRDQNQIIYKLDLQTMKHVVIKMEEENVFASKELDNKNVKIYSTNNQVLLLVEALLRELAKKSAMPVEDKSQEIPRTDIQETSTISICNICQQSINKNLR